MAGTASARRGRQPAGPASPLRRHRNVPLAAGGALLVIACALLAALAWSAAGHRQPVLVLTRDVAAGQAITASDLQVAQVSASGPVSLVPAGQEAQFIGRPAASDLPAGSLLSAADVGSAAPGRGQVRLGVALKPGQYPPDLAPGQAVDVLAVPAADASGSGGQGSAQAAALPVGTAVVLSVAQQATGDGVVAELQLSQDVMPQVAAAASSGLAALATIPGNG